MNRPAVGSGPARPRPLPGRPVGPGGDQLPGRRHGGHRDALHRRQRLPRHAATQGGRPSYAHGTFVNGFHETWPIRHAESAFGFARTGQTIVNAPDTKVLKIYVEDEPLTFGTADLEHYERRLDFRDGVPPPPDLADAVEQRVRIDSTGWCR